MASVASKSEVADDELTRLLMATIAASIRSDNADRSLRQLAVLYRADSSWLGHRLEHLETSHHTGFGPLVGIRSHQS